MKAIVKRLLRAAWRRLGPVRRPILRKFDNHLRALLAPLIEAVVRASIAEAIDERILALLRDVSRGTAENLGRIEAFRDASTRAAYEADLVLNSLVREIVRLQMQVEYLQQLVSPPVPAPAGDFRHVDRDEPIETLARPAATTERALVG